MYVCVSENGGLKPLFFFPEEFHPFHWRPPGPWRLNGGGFTNGPVLPSGKKFTNGGS